jgi:hypothetical protein
MSSPGFVSLSGITVLTPPRAVDPQKGSRNVVFDANFFIVDGSDTSSLTLLRFFIPEDMIAFIQKWQNNPDPTFKKAFVIANVLTFHFSTFSLLNLNTDFIHLERHIFTLNPFQRSRTL